MDTVMTLARWTPVEAAATAAVLGPDDLLMTWPKPVWNKNLSYSHEEWLTLPNPLNLRQIKVTITAPGMRNQSIYPKPDEPEPNRYYDRSLTNDRGGDHVGDGSGGTIRDEHAWCAFVL